VRVRASIGTLAKAGLIDLKMLAEPTTAYLLQHCEKCLARCAFCDLSYGEPRIARVTWPSIELGDLLPRLRAFDRVCVQSVLKRGWLSELLEVLEAVSTWVKGKGVSAAITPIPSRDLARVVEYVDCIGIGLDAATPRLFRVVGKPFTWSVYESFARECVDYLGEGRVFIHIIAGLGESVAEALATMKRLYSMGCRVALFSYTPSPKHSFPGIDVHSYRFLQVARQCLEEGIDPEPYADLSGPKPRFRRLPPIRDPLASVLTSGCPKCNRPFYNESPRGPIMNFPNRILLTKFAKVVEEELRAVGAL